MRKNTFKSYEAPYVEIIEIENQGVLCASAGNEATTNATNVNTHGGFHRN